MFKSPSTPVINILGIASKGMPAGVMRFFHGKSDGESVVWNVHCESERNFSQKMNENEEERYNLWIYKKTASNSLFFCNF